MQQRSGNEKTTIDHVGSIGTFPPRRAQADSNNDGLPCCPSQAVMQKRPEILVALHAAALACEGQFDM